VATFFLAFTYGFVDLATLSFLGLGVAPGTPDWGNMVSASQVLVFENPWSALAPLLLIVVTAVSANVLGESLEGALLAKVTRR
jgi:ABC-type dipeptide/oligopeptide/nickel transport system permease subunit